MNESDSIFSALLSEKFKNSTDFWTKLQIYQEKLLSVIEELPVGGIVKDGGCADVFKDYVVCINDYISSNPGSSEEVVVESLEVFKVYMRAVCEQNASQFRDIFLLNCTIPILEIISERSPETEWVKKYYLKTLIYFLRHQEKKNRHLYAQILKTNLRIKLIDHLYYCSDFVTQFRIVMVMKYLYLKRDILTYLDELFPRCEVLQRSFEEMMENSTFHEFLNTFNNMNRFRKILSISGKVVFGDKPLNEGDGEEFYVDFNLEVATISMIVDPAMMVDSSICSGEMSQQSFVFWKEFEVITIPFRIIETVENFIKKEENQLIYTIKIKFNDNCHYELLSSKMTIENTRFLKIKTKAIPEANGQLLEKFLRQIFNERYIVNLSTNHRSDHLNINYQMNHSSCTGNSSLISDVPTVFRDNVENTSDAFRTIERFFVVPPNLEPVMEETLHNTTVQEEIVGPSDELPSNMQIDTTVVSSDGIETASNESDRPRVGTIQELIYGYCDEVNSSSFDVSLSLRRSRSPCESEINEDVTIISNSEKSFEVVRSKRPVQTVNTPKRERPRKNVKKCARVISDSDSDEVVRNKRPIQTVNTPKRGRPRKNVKKRARVISNSDSDDVADIAVVPTRKNVSDSVSVVSTVSEKLFKKYDFEINEKNMIAQRTRSCRERNRRLGYETEVKMVVRRSKQNRNKTKTEGTMKRDSLAGILKNPVVVLERIQIENYDSLSKQNAMKIEASPKTNRKSSSEITDDNSISTPKSVKHQKTNSPERLIGNGFEESSPDANQQSPIVITGNDSVSKPKQNGTTKLGNSFEESSPETNQQSPIIITDNNSISKPKSGNHQKTDSPERLIGNGFEESSPETNQQLPIDVTSNDSVSKPKQNGTTKLGNGFEESFSETERKLLQVADDSVLKSKQSGVTGGGFKETFSGTKRKLLQNADNSILTPRQTGTTKRTNSFEGFRSEKLPRKRMIGPRKHQLDLISKPEQQQGHEELFGPGSQTQETVGEPVSDGDEEDAFPLSILREIWKNLETLPVNVNRDERGETSRNDRKEASSAINNDVKQGETSQNHTIEALVDQLCTILRTCIQEFTINIERTIDVIKKLDIHK